MRIDFEPATSMLVNMQEAESFSVSMDGISEEDYHGAYSFTPSEDAQIIETAGKLLRENIIIEPIPSYYGRVEWDGSALTII